MNENLLALPFSGNGKGPAVNANLIFGMIDRGDFILCRFNRIRIAGGEVNRLSITLQLPYAGYLDFIPAAVVKIFSLKLLWKPFHTHLPIKTPLAVQLFLIGGFTTPQRLFKAIVRQCNHMRVLFILLNNCGIFPIIQVVRHRPAPLSQSIASFQLLPQPSFGPRLRPRLMVPNGEKPISGAFQIGLVCIIIAQRLSFVYFINGKYCFHIVIFVLFSQRLGTVQQGQEYSSRFREK